MKSPTDSLLFSRLGEFLTKVLLFFFAFSMSLNASRLLTLPYSNPYSIGNPHNIEGFNPENNYLLFVGTIIFTIVFYYGLTYFLKRRPKLTRYFLIAVVTVLLFIGSVAPSFLAHKANIDPFHQGEQLSPALAYYHGDHLYDKIFFLHGAGEDAVFPALAFHLFGKSIGSYFMLVGLLELISGVLFFVLVERLFRPHDSYLLVLTWFLIGSFSAFSYVRDIPVWLSIMLLYSLIFSRVIDRRYWLKVAGLGVMSAVTLFYAIDRGVFLLLINLLFVGAHFLLVRKGDVFVVAPRKAMREKLTRTGVMAGSYLGVFVIFLISLGGHSFVAFLKMSFVEIPRYQGLLFNYPFPNLDATTALVWLPIVILALACLLYADRLRAALPKLSPTMLFSGVLIVFSLIFFRAASGRPDVPHIAYATPILFLTAFYICQQLFTHKSTLSETISHNWQVVLVVILLGVFPTFDVLHLPALNQASIASAKQFRHLPSVPDDAWLTPEIAQVRDYVTTNSTKDDYLFVFTNKPIYYYLTDRRNPSRFYISWFADPQPFTNEMLSDLKKNQPKFVIYETEGFYDAPDAVPMSIRVPEVNQWILDNYPNTVTIGTTKIRTK